MVQTIEMASDSPRAWQPRARPCSCRHAHRLLPLAGPAAAARSSSLISALDVGPSWHALTGAAGGGRCRAVRHGRSCSGTGLCRWPAARRARALPQACRAIKRVRPGRGQSSATRARGDPVRRAAAGRERDIGQPAPAPRPQQTAPTARRKAASTIARARASLLAPRTRSFGCCTDASWPITCAPRQGPPPSAGTARPQQG
jgi:hypothetical protein